MGALPAAKTLGKFPASRDMAETLLVACRGRMAKTEDDPAVVQFYREVGGRIKDARTVKGWSRERLAVHLNVSMASVKNYESGEIAMGRITQLSEALGVDPRWLLHGDRALQEQLSEVLEALAEIRQAS